MSYKEVRDDDMASIERRREAGLVPMDIGNQEQNSGHDSDYQQGAHLTPLRRGKSTGNIQVVVGKGRVCWGKGKGSPPGFGKSSLGKKGGKKGHPNRKRQGKGKCTVLWPVLPLRRLGTLAELVPSEGRDKRKLRHSSG